MEGTTKKVWDTPMVSQLDIKSSTTGTKNDGTESNVHSNNGRTAGVGS